MAQATRKRVSTYILVVAGVLVALVAAQGVLLYARSNASLITKRVTTVSNPPVYPGARPIADNSFSVGQSVFWSGEQLTIYKLIPLQTQDSPAAVLEFYRAALEKEDAWTLARASLASDVYYNGRRWSDSDGYVFRVLVKPNSAGSTDFTVMVLTKVNKGS